MQFHSRRGGIISGMLFAGLIVFISLVVAGVIVARIVRVRTADRAGDSAVSIAMPGGQLNIHASDHMNPAITGVPVYPGASQIKDGGASIRWNSKDGDSDKDVNVVGGEFRTPDSVPRVVDFYRQQLPNVLVVSDENKSTRLEYRSGGIQRIISIRRQDAETRIGVAAIGGGESN